MFNGSGKITWIGKPGQSRKCRCTLRTSDPKLHKSFVQSSQRIVFKGVQEICTFLSNYFQPPVVCSGIEKKKTNFDSRPIYRFVKTIYKLIPLKNAGYGAGR